MNLPPQARRFTRIPVAYRVKVVAKDRILAFPTVVDISMGGLMVCTSDQLPLGSECGIAILLMGTEEGQRVIARGRVVRSDHRGLAFEFMRETMAPESLDTLRQLVRALSPEADQEYELHLRSGA